MASTQGNIVLLHGRGLKPAKDLLEDLWFEALFLSLDSTEIERVTRFNKELLYYGDLSNEFLEEDCHDIGDRRAILDSLRSADFSRFPGETSYTIEEPPEDIEAYWNTDSDFSQKLSLRVDEGLARVLSEGEETILFAHSLGAVLVTDALKRRGQDSSNLTLVTLGSPQTFPHFKEHSLSGAVSVKKWVNVSAKGDLICGPPPEEAIQLDLFNPTLRDGEPDPHHALGYLCHPEVGGLLSKWLVALP